MELLFVRIDCIHWSEKVENIQLAIVLRMFRRRSSFEHRAVFFRDELLECEMSGENDELFLIVVIDFVTGDRRAFSSLLRRVRGVGFEIDFWLQNDDYISCDRRQFHPVAVVDMRLVSGCMMFVVVKHKVSADIHQRDFFLLVALVFRLLAGHLKVVFFFVVIDEIVALILSGLCNDFKISKFKPYGMGFVLWSVSLLLTLLRLLET